LTSNTVFQTLLSALNFERFQTFQTPLTLVNAKQALFAFKGDVYSGIDAPSLDAQDLNRSD
jgi:cytoplasmic iron level regulating protein YaaA (DUF328/UPF0246 family)